MVAVRAPKATKVLEGEPATLIREGKVDEAEMKRQSLTHEELISVLNKNGFNDPSDVETCVLEPNGTFYVEGKQPSSDSVDRRKMMDGAGGAGDGGKGVAAGVGGAGLGQRAGGG